MCPYKAAVAAAVTAAVAAALHQPMLFSEQQSQTAPQQHVTETEGISGRWHHQGSESAVSQ
jgi:hypothetical protein